MKRSIKKFVLLIGLLNTCIALADDYPCSKNGIERVVEKKISMGQTKEAVLAILGGEVMQDYKYQDSPLDYELKGKPFSVWSIAKINAKQCRSMKSLFFVRSKFVISLFFDKDNKLLASEVTGYHDSL